MWEAKTFWCVCHLLVAVKCYEIRDFVAVNDLGDGEVETRVFFGGVVGKQVAVSSEGGVKFRQVADHKHLVRLIFDDDDELQDCEIINQKQQLRKFLNTFKSDLTTLLTTSNVTIQSLDDKQLPHEISSWFNLTETKSTCKKLHHKLKHQLLETNSRAKRDVTDLLRVPGTRWCGKGYSADKYTRLGGFSRTDKCCRRHDLSCRFWIGGFEKKYGLFNWRVNTIMHCSCDERFRACLKTVGSSDANLVGKLFFNVVQSKCFVIKPRKTCVKSTFWGQCTKYKHIKQAMLRDNLPY